MDGAQMGSTSPLVKRLLTPEEASEALGIRRTLLYQLLMTRKIFSVKIGASRRIPLQAIDDYVEQLCAQQKGR